MTGRPIVRKLCAWLAILAVLSGSSPLPAATFHWNNTTGNWSLGTNWGGSAPSGTEPTDILIFGGSGATGHTSTNDIPAPTGEFFLNQFQLNSAASVLNTSAGYRWRKKKPSA